jgi:hypothetical protein
MPDAKTGLKVPLLKVKEDSAETADGARVTVTV